MRFSKKESHVRGTERSRKKFAFFPKKVNRVWILFEYYYVIEIWTSCTWDSKLIMDSTEARWMEEKLLLPEKLDSYNQEDRQRNVQHYVDIITESCYDDKDLKEAIKLVGSKLWTGID